MVQIYDLLNANLLYFILIISHFLMISFDNKTIMTITQDLFCNFF